MKPTNYKDNNCESTSSNCVVYDGPDLACLKICKGDSVTQVEFALATQLCTILDQLDISTYQLQCLGVPGVILPDFKTFINLLINKVCTAPGSTLSGGTVTSIPTNQNETVNLASAFQYPDPSNGDLVTKDTVPNYVQKIGLTVGGIINQVATIQQFDSQISSRVQTLENAPIPSLELPLLRPTGIADTNTLLPLDKFVATLEREFVSFQNAVGDTTNIYNSITTPPSDFNNAKALGTTGGVLGTLTGWITDPKTLADSVQNLWLTVLDARSGTRNLQVNFATACEGIAVDFTGTLENKILKLFFNGTIPTSLGNCQGAGSLFKVTDNSGNYFNTTVDIKANLNNASGVSIDLNTTSLNFADDLKVTSIYCLSDPDSGTTCQNYLEALVNNNFNCPTVTLTPVQNSVSYQFTHVSGSLTYSIQLFDRTNTMIQSVNNTASNPISITGTFSSLISGQPYKVRLQMITMNNTKTCPFVPFDTLPNPCAAPVLISAIVDL